MADIQDRDASGVDRVAGLTHGTLMKNDPIWAALRSEIAALKALVNETKAKHNALLAKMDLDGTLAATDWASTSSVTAADSDL
jgi:hypothetical protein